MLATLYLSRGVPMLLSGDELGRTQAGNNNAYCQDGPLSWLDWRHVDADFLACARRLGALRKSLDALRPTVWPGQGTGLAGGTAVGGEWSAADGRPFADGQDTETAGFCGIWVPPVPSDPEMADLGSAAAADAAICCNASASPRRFTLPVLRDGLHWQPAFDSDAPTGAPGDPGPRAGGLEVEQAAGSLVVWVSCAPTS